MRIRTVVALVMVTIAVGGCAECHGYGDGEDMSKPRQPPPGFAIETLSYVTLKGHLVIEKPDNGNNPMIGHKIPIDLVFGANEGAAFPITLVLEHGIGWDENREVILTPRAELKGRATVSGSGEPAIIEVKTENDAVNLKGEGRVMGAGFGDGKAFFEFKGQFLSLIMSGSFECRGRHELR